MSKELRLFDAARLAVDDIHELLDTSWRSLLSPDQLREAAGSITANIEEAFGRRIGPERNQFFRYARGSCRESKERLRASFARKRIAPQRYWKIHNRLTVISKMLAALEADGVNRPDVN